ncbi:hypothetical protein LINPERPRIM_LOCUS15021 [Linum perenne]
MGRELILDMQGNCCCIQLLELAAMLMGLMAGSTCSLLFLILLHLIAPLLFKD